VLGAWFVSVDTTVVPAGMDDVLEIGSCTLALKPLLVVGTATGTGPGVWPAGGAVGCGSGWLVDTLNGALDGSTRGVALATGIADGNVFVGGVDTVPLLQAASATNSSAPLVKTASGSDRLGKNGIARCLPKSRRANYPSGPVTFALRPVHEPTRG